MRMLILCAAVTFWVAGFDVLYACQDVEYDRRAGLYSVPKRFGIAGALLIARAMHIGIITLLVVAGLELCASVARVGGRRRCRSAAGLRAFSCQTRRSQQARRCVFRRERLY